MAFLLAEKKILLIASLLFWVGASSAVTLNCQRWEDLPVLQGGRVKPLYVQGRQTIEFLTGKPSLAPYCQLSLTSLGKEFGPLPTLLTPPLKHQKVRKLLGLDEGGKRIAYSKLLPKEDALTLALRAEEAKLIKRPDSDGSYKRSLQRILSRIQLYRHTLEGKNWTVPKKNGEWIPLAQLAPSTPAKLSSFFHQVREESVKSKGKKTHVELFYAKSSIHFLSLPFILLSLLLLASMKNPRLGLMGTLLCLLIQLTAIILRVIISGRAPVTNMYETVLFSGWGALVISFILSTVSRERIYVIGGLAYNFLCTLMLNFAHDMLSGKISPLVPVLRDNFWLSTHVTTVILSYGTFALSWVLANILLIKRCLVPIPRREWRRQGELIYTCLKVGTVLLSLGIILGGVWADYSWGRFWGWDPKETWSAIALCLYLAILHGKYTNWMQESSFIPSVAAAFMGIMMAWFGVNYVLSTGLHSYGFSSGGAIFLASFFAIQILILIGSSLCKKSLS